MGKASEIRTTHDIVFDILKSQPKARNSDNYLMYWVYKTVGIKHGIDIDSMSLPKFFLHMTELNFPTTETIRRARQKIQAENPDLCGNSDVEAQRKLNEEDFIEYARRLV